MTRTGVFTISLDFELYWGVRDHRPIDGYEANLRGVREAIPAMLALFREFRIHATWAAVGFLMFRNAAELRASVPEVLPAYREARFSPYGYIATQRDLEPLYHFAPDLIERIRATPGQEIGTHTFSHFYCLEEGGTLDAFECDIRQALSDAERRGIDISSIVLPRNQFSEAHLDVLARCGIRCYRGNEPHPLYDFTEQARNTRFKRILRIVDAYINLTGHHLFDPLAPPRPGGLHNVPASRFLRPYSAPLRWFDALRLQRIRANLDEAAATGRGYHLWWHPHNFGVDLDRNMAFLRSILEHFAMLRERRGMRSLNMRDVSLLRASPVRTRQPFGTLEAAGTRPAH